MRFARVTSYPLVTTVALGKQEALAAWRLEALLSSLVVAALLALTGTIGWLLIRAMSRRSAVENELRLTQQQLLESNQQLERQAMHDALTGLANRRCFDEALTQRSARPIEMGPRWLC